MRRYCSTPPEPAAPERRAVGRSSLGLGISRREFLHAIPGSLLVVGCSRRRYDPSRFHVADRSTVGLFEAPSYDVDFSDVIGRGLRELGVDVRGKRVFLKPNMVEYEPGTAINTNPLVIIGAAVAFRAAGAGGGRGRGGPRTPARHGVPGHPDRTLRSPSRASHPLHRPEPGRRPLRAARESVHGPRADCACRPRCCARTSSCRCQN